MKNKFLQKVIVCVMSLTMLVGTVPVMADSDSDTEDNVVITEDDKPFLSLGADLTADQQNTVLDLMGISADNLDNYDVTYVTNDEEHEYLDSYIASSEIGTRSLSSIVITEGEKGSGLNISTYNINYCTVGMYKNALTTAGITDANIIVAAPCDISGTAALIGIYKAYENMTGKEFSDTIVDASLDELVTTGDIEQELKDSGITSEQVEAMIAQLKEELSKLETDEEMKEAIEEVAADNNVTLTDDEVQQIIDLMKKLKGLDLDWDLIGKQAGELANKVQEFISTDEGKSFIRTIIDFLKGLLGEK